MTSLIAEDDIKMRKLLKEMAGNYFMEIFECDNEQEAYESYKKNKPHRILMDIKMPVMDGITVSRSEYLNLKKRY